MRMSISSPDREHPLLAAARTVGEALDEVIGVDPLYMSVEEKTQLLVAFTRSITRLTALRAGVLATGEDVADETGARSAATWLAVETRTSRPEAAHDERLGAVLRLRWTVVGDAVASGRVTWEQAGVLVRSLEALPDDLDPELRKKAEAHLVSEAGHFDPQALRRLGRHVLEVVAPDVADAEVARALVAEERRARALTRCRSASEGTGRRICSQGCPTMWRRDCGRTWTPTPRQGVRRR